MFIITCRELVSVEFPATFQQSSHKHDFTGITADVTPSYKFVTATALSYSSVGTVSTTGVKSTCE